VKSVDASKDIVQEVIFEMWKKKDTIEFTASIKSYLFRSVHNRSLNFLKAKSNNLSDIEDYDIPVDEPEKNQQLLDAELLSEKIKNEIDNLPEKCRIVFILSRYEEKSYKEISEMLDISIKTVENHVSKALKLLRKNLSYE
jgi:RNA polymerase sigma-70 factor (ECF subfamily)